MHDYSVAIHLRAIPAEQSHGKRKEEVLWSVLHSKPTMNTLRKDLAICRLDVVHREYAGRLRYDGVQCPPLQNVVRDAIGDPRCRVLHGVARKMRLPGRGLDSPIAQRPPDHGDALPQRQRPARAREPRISWYSYHEGGLSRSAPRL